MQDSSDQQLIERALKGDRLAFSELIEKHYDLIYRIAYKWSGNQSDAEDITHNVCMKLARALKSYKGKAAFTSWLYRITLNATRDVQRKQQTYQKMGRELALVAPEHIEPSVAEDTVTDTLWENVKTLPEKQRDAVMLIYSEGMSHKEAAQIIGCSEKTVSWHLHTAREKLKIIMKSN